MATDRSCFPIWLRSWRFRIGSIAIALLSGPLPFADATFSIASAQTRRGRIEIDIPAERVVTALATLSAKAGVSIGASEPLPDKVTTGVRGRMAPAEALRRMLRGTGLRATQVGALAFRIERSVKPVRATATQERESRPRAPPPLIVDEIIVTGQKRPQAIGEVPMSLAIASFGDLSGGVVPGARDVAATIEGLALTNLGPGRNRQFIRGVADSAFNGLSQSTVAVLLDDARITFDAPDPDLRLADVERVEILKGPQGPLYGSGALGGIYHIVAREPLLDQVRFSGLLSAQTVTHGETGGSVDAMLNLPIVTDRLGVRAVGYAVRDGGWIDDIGGRRDANRTVVSGGRATARWQPASDWTIDIGAVTQSIGVRDSQYVTASHETLDRRVTIAEPTDNDFRAFTGVVKGHVGEMKAVWSSSHIRQSVDFVVDASAAPASLGGAGVARLRDNRSYTLLNQEVRLSPASDGRWLIGASYLRARSHNVSIVDGPALKAVPVETLDRRVVEAAAFAEGSVVLRKRITATLGVRLFHTVAEDEQVERSGGKSDRIGKTIVSPSLAFSWMPSDNAIVYLRYASSLRPGGLAPSGSTFRRFDSDELGTFDLGFRTTGALSLTGSAFFTIWDDIQSDYLLPNGLTSTRNAGRARIFGVEAAADWRIGDALRVIAGASFQDAMLTRNDTGVRLDDRRLPVSPSMTGRLRIERDFNVDGWQATLSGGGYYVGPARLSFDESLDRRMGDYAALETRASLSRNGVTLGARIDNLLDIRGDTFAFGNPFTIRTQPQFTPLRPRTFTISIGRSW